MASWIIYGSNNVAKATVKELELHDEWMAECYLTISVKSATPIAFAVGDYIDYRGERYTIQYDPNVLKKATSGSYGEGFTYDNIKFVGLQDEVVRCDFNDIVLNDNDIHYSALPTFPFYCESVDDLLDRIQANLEDLYPGQWIIIGLNTVRNAQRGTAVGRAQAFLNAYKQYIDPTGAANTDPYGKQGVAETADNITCWDAMKKVHDDFDLNFIVRGRVIVVGTAGVFTANTFRYGKGNGLYELERIGESDQRIVTRLRAYGSEQNIPAHYYNTINKQVYATVTSILHKFDTTGADFLLDLDFDRKYFTYRSESYPGTTEAPNYIIEMMANDVTVRGYVTKDATTGKCYVYCESVAGDDDRDEPDATKMAAFVQALTANDRLDFVEYVNKDAFGEGHYDYGTGHLPDNMAVSRLMLPGFPTMSLHAWVQAHKDDADKAWLAQAIADGFTFSNEVYRPYIDSPNKTQYGVRPGSIYFDGSDDKEDVHPTIEGMTYNGAPIDEVYAADQVEDNGVYPAGEEVKNIKIILPVLGFELDKVYEEGASIDMKDGMCGARSFKMAGTPKKDANNRWVCTVERVHDDALDLWFPYCDFQIHGSSEAGRQHGDNYVLTGIDMPDAYIAAASVKLLQVSIEALKKNHAPRYTYQPRIDELWMQRQHDTATASQGVASLHDTLKAGDVFAFADTDLNIDANIIIDVLTIRENGNNGIPTYEVTLRDEKQVGTIQKITNKVDSIVSGAVSINGATGGGLTARQIQSLIDRYGGEQFLSKLNDDTAQGYIKMLKGLQIGANFVPDILGEGGVLRMRQDGKVELVTDILYARMRAYFDSVVIREYRHESGNRIKSPAQGFNASRVEYIKVVNDVETIVDDASEADFFRCYWRVDDGEKKAENQFIIGDLAFCEHSDIVNGALVTKRYWRVVTGRNAGNTTTADGEAWIDLSNAHDANGAPIMTTITWEGQGGTTQTLSVKSFESATNAYPEAHDDICMLGCVVDSTRQGAIIEYVSGTNAPAYQIYQGLGADATNPYTLTNKNQISIGYNSATGKADMKVYGDAYIGDRNRSTFIEYKQDDGTQQHAPILNVKAVMQTLPNSTYEGKSASQFVQDNQIKYDSAIQNLTNITNDLQSQIDGQVETFFYNGTPSDSVLPESEWKAIDIAAGNNNERLKHLGDLYYDNQTGYAYRYSNSGSEASPVFFWNPISDSAVIKALTEAAAAFGLANTKAKTFTTASNTLPSPPYKTGDLWLNATGTWGSGDAAVTWNGDILKVKANINRASGDTPLISDWELAGNYLNEQDFLDWKAGQYATDLTNAANNYLNDSVANAIKSALGSALGASTLTDGGLMLTSLIYLRKLNAGGDPTDVNDYTTWAGISGEYDDNANGGGLAAWYGGNPIDKEALTPEQIGTVDPQTGVETGWPTLRWSKGVDRFDGSGYRANGNITWDETGALTIKNITTLSDSNNNNILNELATFNSAFTFGTSGQGSTTALYITPNVPFQSLYIGTSNANKKEVATQEWVGNYYISKAWFSNILKVHYTQNSEDKVLSPNEDFPQDATDKTLESVFSFWTNYGLTALGRGVSGSQVVSVLDDLNDVDLGSTINNNDVLTYDSSTHKWTNKPAQGGSTVAALGDLTDVGISSLADKDILQYDYTNNVWKNVTLATALSGYATESWVGQQGYITGITSSMVTTALGYTPFSNSGGTISDITEIYSARNDTPLNLRGGSINTYLGFYDKDNTNLGFYSVHEDHQPYFFYGGTNYKIWTEGNDGSSSGLDADLLDGQHGSYYAAASDLNNYLPLTGGMLTGADTGVLSLNAPAAVGETGLVIKRNGSSKAWFGYHDNGFVYMYNSYRGKYLAYNDNGTLLFEGQTVIHSGNIGSQSVNYATSAGSATNDSDGNAINSTYFKKTGGTISGTTEIYSTGNNDTPLNLRGGSINTYLGFFDKDNTNLGFYSVYSSHQPYFYYGGSNYMIWTEGNDGSGSGLDADLLDGQHGSYYAAASDLNNYLPLTGGTLTGSLSVNSTITSSGGGRFGGTTGVWIGATYNGGAGGYDCIERANSGSMLYMQYYHSGGINMCYGGGNVGIGGNGSYKLHVFGDVYATGGVTSLSDIRKKDVISYELPLSVEQIANAPTIKFTWKDKREEGEQVGTIAQYWEKVLPESIKDKSGELSMSYGVAALISVITTARSVVDHEKRITELERENADLKQAYSFIKNAYDYLKMDYEQLKLRIA